MQEPWWQPEWTEQAKGIWADYQRRNDVSSRVGQTVGIDPVSGRVWFGDDIAVIRLRMAAEGDTHPLYFVRVGSDHCWLKVGKQVP